MKGLKNMVNTKAFVEKHTLLGVVIGGVVGYLIGQMNMVYLTVILGAFAGITLSEIINVRIGD